MTEHAPIMTHERAVELVASRPDLLARANMAAGQVQKFSNFALTARQKEVLDFIRYYSSQEGLAPSYDEMVVAIGVKSKSQIARTIDALIERGHLVKLHNRARSVSLVEAAA